MRILATAAAVGFPLFGVLFIVTALGGEDTGGAWFGLVWMCGVIVQSWWILVRMPWSIETDDAGLTFVSRSGRQFVGWGDLESVRSPWYDLNHQQQRWAWRGGRRRSMGQWENQHRLLSEIERRAPHVDVRV